MTTDESTRINPFINTENHISFSDEMASPNWDWHWDYLHSDFGKYQTINGSYRSNCKSFEIYWCDTGDYGQYDGRIPFDWFEITLYGKSPTLEDKSFILFYAQMPSIRSHGLNMLKHWMTSQAPQDFIANAKEMLDDAEWDYHEGDKTYEQRGWNTLTGDILAADLLAKLYKEQPKI